MCLSPLVVADEIILVTAAPLGKSLDQIDNFFDIEDFKLKMNYAVRDFLKNRLHLETSEEKSKIINLKKNSSEFLGL
jgi:hypothetical protein